MPNLVLAKKSAAKMNFGGTVRVNRFGLLIICCLLVLFLYYLSPSSAPPEVKKVSLRQVLLAAIEAAERGGKEVIKLPRLSLRRVPF